LQFTAEYVAGPPLTATPIEPVFGLMYFKRR